MTNFLDSLVDVCVDLRTAKDVALFSFITQNSISYLDLQLCQHSEVLLEFCTLPISNSFINTEEKCRKFFDRRRNILYTLNLDLPKWRESSLRGVPDPESSVYAIQTNLIHLDEITPTFRFYDWIFESFVTEAISINEKKLKILDWTLKHKALAEWRNQLLKIQTMNEFIDCFYPVITDSDIFKDFLVNLDFSEWICEYEKPDILEYLLCYARQYGRVDLKEDIYSIDNSIDLCIFDRHFLNIGPLLNYINVPKLSNVYCCLYFGHISITRPSFTDEVLDNIEQWMKKERNHLMLQFIWVYMDCAQHHRDKDASEALRLIWSSVPESYISFKEMQRALSEVFSEEELKTMYNFYVTAIGKFSENAEPRTLQHLCRATIRTALRENKIWIPDGLKRLGLPKSLQSFLKLENELTASNSGAVFK